MPKRSLLVLILSSIVAATAFHAVLVARSTPSVQSTAAATSRDSRLDWWRDARFGMFIHWGLYAVPAGEWGGKTNYGEWIRSTAQIPLDEYDTFRGQFNPKAFDAAAWARMAKRAGMRYVVLTTKHHDGFALFDSKLSSFTVMQTPFKRDIVREYVEACRKEGLRVGFYHSIMDWHHPDYAPRRDWEKDRPTTGADFERFVTYLKGQLKELLTNYGPIDILWFDGQWEGTWTNARGKDLYAYVRSLQPNIIVNNRVGRSGGDFGLDRAQEPIGDFGTPEQEIPATGVPGLDWETCMTMNRNWGYNRADKDFKPTDDLVRKLVDIASKGGNFLLNVGPMADGLFPPESVERLEGIGRWMDVNGTSIHGTEASPFPVLPWGRATQKRLPGGGTRLFLHVFDWPANGQLVVNGLLSDPRRAFLLADQRRPLLVSRRDDAVVITLPSAAPDAIDSVVALDIDGRPDVTTPPVITVDSEIFVSTATVSIATNRDAVELRYTKDGTEPGAASPLVNGPIVLRDTTTVSARAFRGGKAVSPTASVTATKVKPRPALAASAVVPGLRFVCVEGEFSRLPDFDHLTPSATGTVEGFDLKPRTAEARFAMQYRGYIKVPSDGAYRFFVRSDDGSRMWVGETLVVENDGLHSAHEESGVVALAAGLHPITVAMFEQSGGFELGVSWQAAGMFKQPVPAGVLFRDR